jgi:hypothetical protein
MQIGDIINGWKIIEIDYKVNDYVVEKDGVRKITLHPGK